MDSPVTGLCSRIGLWNIKIDAVAILSVAENYFLFSPEIEQIILTAKLLFMLCFNENFKCFHEFFQNKRQLI